MNHTYLLIDSNNLCYRSFYAMGGLSYQSFSTGVYFGFFGAILQLQGQFGPASCVFCFDSKHSKRKLVCSTYKEHRHENHTPDQQERLSDLYQQITGLRTKYLKQIGFKNVFLRKGFEADDLLASVCRNLGENDRAIVVSTDSDLLQLLSVKVKIYDPRKKFLWTLKRFRQTYGIRNPKDWAVMKALAGCSTDNVKGIPGVGEKTAIKFINFTLPETSKKYIQILSKEGQAIRKRNLPLVTLPWPGLKPLKLKRDRELDWTETLQQLGIKSLEPSIAYREKPRSK